MGIEEIVLPPHANPIVLEWIRDGKVKVMDSGCWEWQLGKIQGYGQVLVNKRPHRTHRLAINCEKGLSACHNCDNPSCCNPWHLRQDTHANNLADTRGKKNKFGQCICGRARMQTSVKCQRCCCKKGPEAFDAAMRERNAAARTKRWIARIEW